MPYIYENDPTKIGTNLQTAVAYLLSLHKNQYEWNLLGIKVIGVKEALPIPEGTYDYGDAYMIGTEANGYEMWIYTRADEAHSEAYWFNVGAFPKPGPQGPKGDGLEQINKWTNGTVSNVTYNTTDGAKTTQTTTIDYTDSTDGSTKHQQFDTTTTLPIVPGKYISMNATSDNKKMEVKVDDTELALDYVKIDKRVNNTLPIYYNGKINWEGVAVGASKNTVAYRDGNGDCSFRIVTMMGFITPGSNQIIGYWNIWRNIYDEALIITKTTTDTGTLTASDLDQLQAPGYKMIKYEDKLYYRYDPRTAPDGTLNFIHLDSIDDGNGGYKATGKCLSITVSTRAWQVVDLDFGGSTRTTHNLTLTNSSTGMSIYFSLTNNRTETYEGAPVGLLAALENSQITCTVDNNGTYSAGMITTDGTNFKATYGNGEEVLIDQMQVSITDNMV